MIERTEDGSVVIVRRVTAAEVARFAYAGNCRMKVTIDGCEAMIEGPEEMRALAQFLKTQFGITASQEKA